MLKFLIIFKNVNGVDILRSNVSSVLFSFFVIASISLGWNQREEYWLSADKGWGYALGIIGGSMMLLLLLYPVRKHWRLAKNWLSIRHWFKMHMLFGILGPLLILFHSNFQLGSLNSNIALFSMLLVSSSGLIGRFAYQKTHRGLYGEQIQFSKLKSDFEQSKSNLQQDKVLNSYDRLQLEKIESTATEREISLFQSIANYRKLGKIIKTLIKTSSNLSKTSQEQNLLTGLYQLQKMTHYALYTKIFSLWHVFHLPIFFMMIIAGVVHVFVVHMY